jgi:hypothetical protein
LERASIIAEGVPLRTEIGKFTKKIDAALHLRKLAEMYKQLNSVEAAVLTQLRTGKTFLNEYLYKIRALEIAACDCRATELIAYFLFTCNRWVQQRMILRQQHGERVGDLSYALGGYLSRQEGGQSIDGPIEQWELNMEAVKATIEFAKSIGRLQPKALDEESRGEGEEDTL